jgi:hypothetical protein
MSERKKDTMIYRMFFISMLILTSIVSIALTQMDFSLEDLNPNSETFGQLVGPSDYPGDVYVIQFSHEY